MSGNIFIGTDSGATTSKIAAVRENGEAVTTRILQRPTNAQNGTDAVIAGWCLRSPSGRQKWPKETKTRRLNFLTMPREMLQIFFRQICPARPIRHQLLRLR